MAREEIRQYTADFVKGAMVAKRAGFGGVEIHAVHDGYLLYQFAIALYNHRTDEYGGSLENRLRFATDIVKGIKKACGGCLLYTSKYIKIKGNKNINGRARSGNQPLCKGVIFCDWKRRLHNEMCIRDRACCLKIIRKQLTGSLTGCHR